MRVYTIDNTYLDPAWNARPLWRKFWELHILGQGSRGKYFFCWVWAEAACVASGVGFGGYDAVMSPMSLALGWGLALTSGVTLFLVPALYVSANDINRQIDVWRRGRRPELGVADATAIGGDGPEEAAA